MKPDQTAMTIQTLLSELEAGLEGVSDGEWRAECWEDPQWAVMGPAKFQFIVLTSQGNDEAHARHIARCSKPNIRLLISSHKEMLEGMRRAEQFIANGIEFGYIRLPSPPDPALDTPSLLRALIAKFGGSHDAG